jgi:hypothetical protein
MHLFIDFRNKLEASITLGGARPLLAGLHPSIYKGGFARRPVRGTAANSPTTTRRAAPNPSLQAGLVTSA